MGYPSCRACQDSCQLTFTVCKSAGLGFLELMFGMETKSSDAMAGNCSGAAALVQPLMFGFSRLASPGGGGAKARRC